MKINIMYSKWGSHAFLAEWLADAFRDKGYEVTTDIENRSKIKHLDGHIIYIGGEPRIISFASICQRYEKPALYWIDFFIFREFRGYKILERRYREVGGKLVTTTEYERQHLEERGITVDAVIPRCIPDSIFKYDWKGTKKEVMSIGFSDYRRDNRWWKCINPPQELDHVTRKGHELLVEFASNNPDWEVKLVTQTEELEKAITIPTLSNLEIIEAGSLSPEEKYEMLMNTGVFCLPTRLDSCPLVVMEAEAVGVPTCYTALPPLVEMGGGIEIPVRDVFWYPSKIPLAIIDYEQLEQAIFKTHAMGEFISKFGKRNAEKFKASVITDKLLEVIQ